MSDSTSFSDLRTALTAALTRLAPRERRAALAAAALLGLALLWWLALAPALSTLRAAPERHARLDVQLSQMSSMAAAAAALRAQPPAPALGRDAVLQALEQASAALGASAQLSVLGERASVTLTNASPQALAEWLLQVRVNARLLPLQAQLSRSGEPPAWSGTLVLSGPGLRGAD